MMATYELTFKVKATVEGDGVFDEETAAAILKQDLERAISHPSGESGAEGLKVSSISVEFESIIKR